MKALLLVVSGKFGIKYFLLSKLLSSSFSNSYFFFVLSLVELLDSIWMDGKRKQN